MQRNALWRSVLAAAVLLLAPLTAATGAPRWWPSGHACAPLTESVRGTITGSDGNLVNATVALTFIDWQGHELTVLGCPQKQDAVGASVAVNYMLSSSGAAPGPNGDAGVGAVSTWSISNIPINVAAVQLETYPREQAPNAVNVRHTDLSHYARSMRHVDLPYDRPISVVLPRDDTCAAHIPGTSDVVVQARRVQPQVVDGHVRGYHLQTDPIQKANAFSSMPDHNDPGHGSPILGLSLGLLLGDRGVLLAHLAPAPGRGQPYTIFYATAAHSGKAYSADYGGRQTFGVRACHDTNATILEVPTTLTVDQRHELQDLLTKRAHSYLLTVNT